MSDFTFDFTVEKLAKLIHNNDNVDKWHAALVTILPDYDITTVERVAAFIAQTAHESGDYTRVVENLNYRAEALTAVWPSRFPPSVAKRYAHKPEAIANRAYANRMGNGDESSGDGWKYRGHGLIQLTGKANHTEFANSIGIPLEEVIDYLNTFEGSVQSACWFWEKNNLNKFADIGDIKGMTKVINGGYLGLPERASNFKHALSVLGGE